MRITNGMLVSNMLRNINKNLSRLEKIQQQASTGLKIKFASDDPIIATRAVKIQSYVSDIEQLQKNADDAKSWMDFSESTLDQLGENMQRIRELTVEAANDTNTDDDRTKILVEIEELEKSLLEMGNTSYSGRYIFAGFDTDEAPFETADTAVGEKILYKGKYLDMGGTMSASISDADIEAFYMSNMDKISSTGSKQEILYKVSNGSRLNINVEGDEVFGDADGNVFDTMAKLKLALNGETSYKTAEYVEGPPADIIVQSHELDISGLLGELDTDINRILKARSDLGARTNYVELTQNRLDTNHTTFTELLSKNIDADYAEVSMRLASAQAAYSAALSVGADVIQPSLLDFLD